MNPLRSLFILVLALAGILGAAQAQQLQPNDSVVLIARGMSDTEVSVLNGVYNIDSSGNLLGLPYLDGVTVPAAGLTPPQLAQRIARAYLDNQIYTRAQFTVTSGNPDQPRQMYTIGGEVNGPGAMPWRHELTLQMAIAEAGGPTQFSAEKVIIERGEQRIEVDLGTREGRQFVIQPRDYVEVWQQGVLRPIPPGN